MVYSLFLIPHALYTVHFTDCITDALEPPFVISPKHFEANVTQSFAAEYNMYS